MPGGRPRLSDEVKKARGTFRPSRAANATPAGRKWPIRDPACADMELQDEAVAELQACMTLLRLSMWLAVWLTR
jgi:hypothetical protein